MSGRDDLARVLQASLVPEAAPHPGAQVYQLADTVIREWLPTHDAEIAARVEAVAPGCVFSFDGEAPDCAAAQIEVAHRCLPCKVRAALRSDQPEGELPGAEGK